MAAGASSAAPGATQRHGRVPAGTVLAAVAPAAAWRLDRPERRRRARRRRPSATRRRSPSPDPGRSPWPSWGRGPTGSRSAWRPRPGSPWRPRWPGRRWWLDWWWRPTRPAVAAPTAPSRPAAATVAVLGAPLLAASPERRRPDAAGGAVTGSLRRALMIAVLVADPGRHGIADRLVARTAPSVGTGPRRAVDAQGGSAGGHRVLGVVLRGRERGPRGSARHHRAHQRREPAGARHLDRRLGVRRQRAVAGAMGRGAHRALTVPTDGQVTVGADQLGSTSLVAAAVVLDGGGVAVSESVQSPLGWGMAPCAPSTAADWYFAHGATAQGGGLILSLFNPTATDAVVDVALVSSTRGLPGACRLPGHRRPARVARHREHR